MWENEVAIEDVTRTSKVRAEETSLNVDLIRSVAIVLVIVDHSLALGFPVFFQIPQGDMWYWLVTNIYKSIDVSCVPLFVMLSGALLLNPSKIESLSAFFRKRLLRIGPPFLFWGAAYFAWRQFANHEVLTFDSIWRGFLGTFPYPYGHFWFIYMLIGLYLVTPILRPVVAHAGSKILSYFLLLWFLGTAIVPLLGQYASIWIASGVFIVPAWLGYFVLGAYLRTVRLTPRLVRALLWMVLGTWLVTFFAGSYLNQSFYDFLSANVILTSGALFLLLRAMPVARLESRFPRAHWLLGRVGQDSFTIYLLHVMVMEVLTFKGLFGFKLGITTLNPILGIPLLCLVTLAICLGVIWLLRKVPVLNKAIGLNGKHGYSLIGVKEKLSLLTRRRLAAVLICVIVLFPIAYLAILNMVVPGGGVRFLVGWEDNTFQTEYGKLGWFDSTFTQGWSVNWTDVESGFTVQGGVIDLYATFNGYNPNHETGLSVITLQKSIDNLGTIDYPYLVIRHRESSADSSLTLSFVVIDDKGGLHPCAYYHTSVSWANLEVNLSNVYSGIVKGILVLFMNGFNADYSGGLQHVYIQTIGFYKSPPTWKLSYINLVNASISSENRVLQVSGNGDIKAGALVSAQRTNGLEFDLNKYRYLNVSIMTSGLDVAARIVIWTGPDLSKAYTVLLKTYDDGKWHTEILDLSFFGISGSGLFMIELGSSQVYEGSSSIVRYRQLSFNELEVT